MTAMTEEQERLCEMVRNFARSEVAPVAAQAERNERFPPELLGRMAELGLLGGQVPVEWGGQGLDHQTYAMVIEEMARVDHIAALYMSMPSSLVGRGLRQFGTDEQRERWLRPLAGGRIFGAAAVTEPRSGSDVGGLTTTYRKVGSQYVLNGSKAWISNLELADFVLTFATRDRSLRYDGISAFIIPRDTPGLGLHPYKDKLGFRSMVTGDISIDDVELNPDCLLGAEGEGFAIAMSSVESGRLSVAARALGGSWACLDESIRYAKSRELFGETLDSFQLTKAKLTEMAMGINAARMLIGGAAKILDDGGPARAALSMAKLYASDLFQRSATEAVQIHGAYGTSADYRVSRLYRDAKVFQLVEGGNEVHRLLIADTLLGRRRER